jgi:hypothetical protein
MHPDKIFQDDAQAPTGPSRSPRPRRVSLIASKSSLKEDQLPIASIPPYLSYFLILSFNSKRNS